MNYTRFTVLAERDFSAAEKEAINDFFLSLLAMWNTSGNVGIESMDDLGLVAEAEQPIATAPDREFPESDADPRDWLDEMGDQ